GPLLAVFELEGEDGIVTVLPFGLDRNAQAFGAFGENIFIVGGVLVGVAMQRQCRHLCPHPIHPRPSPLGGGAYAGSRVTLASIFGGRACSKPRPMREHTSTPSSYLPAGNRINCPIRSESQGACFG